MSENSIEFSLSNSEQRDSWLNSSHRTLDADNPPILAISDSKRKMRLETDASGYTIGGILSQQQEDDSWKPIAYLSRAMNETERNYEIYDRELLAIMEGLKQWQQYLIGSDQFEVWTDHKNLGYFKKPQKLNR